MMKSKRKSENMPNQNGNTNFQKNLWNAAKAVLRGKFIAMQAFLKK